jgi:hypothetical protein
MEDNKQSQISDKGFPSSLGVGRGDNKLSLSLSLLLYKNMIVAKIHTGPQTWADSLDK